MPIEFQINLKFKFFEKIFFSLRTILRISVLIFKIFLNSSIVLICIRLEHLKICVNIVIDGFKIMKIVIMFETIYAKYILINYE